MKAPQIIIIVAYAWTVFLNLYKHGERKEDFYNVWTAIIGVVISAVLLGWGGFWN